MIKFIILAFSAFFAISCQTVKFLNTPVMPFTQCKVTIDCKNPSAQYCNTTINTCYYKDSQFCTDTEEQCVSGFCPFGYCGPFDGKSRKYGDTCNYELDCEVPLKCQIERDGSLGFGDVMRCLKVDEYPRTNGCDRECLIKIILGLTVLAGVLTYTINRLSSKRKEASYVKV